ncbi:TnsD family Tn7-like transposition protein [Paenibacillus alvei]|uniref:Transposon Tn7 transposition protein TnsD C-termianl domain-containing protein n=1 Tax=Paenibacillus alvei TaxID=44250 RepID=A0AAP7A197_PAEAL|nr:TnsD family Tn7-like transposition protein [Paenibacillus alvei]NOJ73556.1 hypothetical protein [Paenibacillus alvei]
MNYQSIFFRDRRVLGIYENGKTSDRILSERVILLLAYFPTLYEDELLYSGIARYHMNVGNRTQRQTIEDLFGSRLICATTDLPSHLEILASRINNLYSCEQLIQNHTLFPYYAYFMNQDKIDQAKVLMKRGASQGEVHAILGLLANKVKAPNYLRFCQECYKAEDNEYEPYWHRSHQLPGVNVCSLHNHPLTISNVDYTTQNHKFEFVALSKIRVEHFPMVDVDARWTEDLEYIAEQSVSILVTSHLKTNTMPNYKNFLYEKGYLTAKGRVKFNQLIIKFRQFYSDKLLQFLNCEVTSASETWFHKVIRSPKEIIHPLRHLLVLRFLKVTLDSSVKDSSSPFGDGPWPCLNKAADHYHLDVINKCTISRCSKTALPVGTFLCSCGFVYSRRGPDRSSEDKYRIGRIKVFGHVWFERLTEVNASNLSLRHKARLLGVDPGTIKNQIELMRKDKVLYSEGSIKEQTRHSESIVQTSKQFEKCKASTIKFKRADWEKRDEILLYSAIKAVNQIKSLPEPQRIPLASIARFSNAGDFSVKILKNLSKLPKTRNFISKQLDTTETYQIRRLVWAANKLNETKGKVEGWRLMRMAGLNYPLTNKVHNKYIELLL